MLHGGLELGHVSPELMCHRNSDLDNCSEVCRIFVVLLRCEGEAMARARATISDNQDALLANLSHYYDASLVVSRSFGGPSVYFHERAIEFARKEWLSHRHIEHIYATLASWGMHRMGNTSTKMVDFDRFEGSILSARNRLEGLRAFDLASRTADELAGVLDQHVRPAFETLSVSQSEAHLVGNSKALHHVLPDLIPPVDRQHTVRFFCYSIDEFKRRTRRGKMEWCTVPLPDSFEEQYGLFRNICLRMRDVLASEAFRATDMAKGRGQPFQSSLTKVADNVIMAYVKEKGGEVG